MSARIEDGVEPVVPLDMLRVSLGLVELRRAIEERYEVSRERALALTKLDECGMWLDRCRAKAEKEEEER